MGGGASRGASQPHSQPQTAVPVATPLYYTQQELDPQLHAERSAAAAAMGAPASVRDTMAVAVGHGGAAGGSGAAERQAEHVGWDEADQEVIRQLGRATAAAHHSVDACWASLREEVDLQQALWVSSAPANTAAEHGGEAVFAALREGIERKDSGRIASAVSGAPDSLSAALQEVSDGLASAEQTVFIWRRLDAGVKNSDRLEIEAWVDGVDDSGGALPAEAVAGARRFLGRLVNRERRALERLEGQQAMYAQIEFGINTLDLALLTGLITHAEERGLDPTPARLAMQDVRKKLREKEQSEAAAAAAAAAEAAEVEWEQQQADKEAREAQESADAAFAIAEQRRWRKQEKEAAAQRTKAEDQEKFEHWTAGAKAGKAGGGRGGGRSGGGGGGRVFGGKRGGVGGGSDDEEEGGISVEEAYARVERERGGHERKAQHAHEQQARENARRYAKRDRMARKQQQEDVSGGGGGGRTGGYAPGAPDREQQPRDWAGLKRDNEPREWVDGHTAEEAEAAARRRAEAKAKRDAEQRARQQQAEAEARRRRQERERQQQRGGGGGGGGGEQRRRRPKQPSGGSGGTSTADALKLLGLSREAGGGLPAQETIRKAYRKAALKWHPDRPHNHDNACVMSMCTLSLSCSLSLALSLCSVSLALSRCHLNLSVLPQKKFVGVFGYSLRYRMTHSGCVWLVYAGRRPQRSFRR